LLVGCYLQGSLPVSMGYLNKENTIYW